MMPPITMRTGLGANTVRIVSPTGTPMTRPGASAPTARQSQVFAASRKPATPTMTCRVTTRGTTCFGGRARLSSGTPASPKPNPVKPRKTAAAKTPAMAVNKL